MKTTTDPARPAARSAVAAVALLAAAAVAGAAPTARAHTKKVATAPSPDAYLGYSHAEAGAASLDGWDLGGSYPVRGRLRLVFDLTGHYGSFATASLSETALMGGVRATWSWRRLSPFAEGSVGLVRTSVSVTGLSEANSAFAFALGGGTDYPLSDRWAARGLLHLRFVRGNGGSDTDPRLSIGVVYRFGR